MMKPIAHITNESLSRLRTGTAQAGTVPVHVKPSKIARHALYTESQMSAMRHIAAHFAMALNRVGTRPGHESAFIAAVAFEDMATLFSLKRPQGDDWWVMFEDFDQQDRF
jgi:hypothetical protein